MPWYNCCKKNNATQHSEEPSTSASTNATKLNTTNEAPEELLTFLRGSSWSRWRLTVMFVCCLMMMYYGLNLFAIELLIPENINFTCIVDGKRYENSCYTRNGTMCYTFNYSQAYGYTLTEKWDLVCSHKTDAEVCHIVLRCGLAIGFVFLGMLTDRWGRKKVLIISLVFQACGGVLLTTSGTVTFFMASTFLYAISLTGSVIVALILACEISPNKWRSFNLAVLCLSISVGYTLLPFVWMICADSMKNILILSLPPIIVILLPGVIKESPNWYLCNNQPNKAQTVLVAVVNFDGLKVPSSFRIRPVQITNLSSARSMPLLNMMYPSSTLMILLTIFLLSVLTSFTCGLVVGHILHANEDLSSIITLLGVSGICAIILSIILYCIMQHNIVIALSSIFACIVAVVTYIVYGPSELLNDHISKLTLQLIVYGFFVTAYYSVWNVIPRIFPTEMRGEGTGITLAMGELSFMTARIIFPKVYGTLTTFLATFCGSTCTILVCCIVLYNVHNRELPDKLEDCIHFRNNHKPVRWSTIRAASPTLDETEIKITDFEKGTSIVVNDGPMFKKRFSLKSKLKKEELQQKPAK